MKPLNSDRLAFDRGTVRTIDIDGRMHIAVSNISKATVNPYYGEEIPDSEALGLDPKKVYLLLRDPAELEKAAPTFNNIQLLSVHVPVSANDPKKEVVVGSTGTDAAFHAPYLTNSLVVWDAEAIKGIESKDQCELSCAYRYDADMTPGTYEGEPYDGAMKNIRGNHVALVEVGRAGPDVVVGDSQLKKDCNMTKKALSGKATLAKGALLAAMPKLAADAKLDLNAILGGVTTANWKENKSAIIAAIKPKLAKDADIADIVTLLDKLDGEEPTDPALDDVDPNAGPALDADPIEEILSMLKGKISDEDHAAVGSKLKGLKLAEKEPAGKAAAAGAQDEPIQTPGAANAEPGGKKEEGVSKAAMDAALASVAKSTEATTIARYRAITAAEEAVKPYVGKLAVACDSAEGVYKVALETMGLDIAGIHPSAYRAVLAAQPKPGDAPVRRIAADQGLPSDFAAQFPDATRSI